MKFFANDEERAAYSKWLQELEVGSVLVLRTYHSYHYLGDDHLSKKTVTRITPTQIHVDNRKFRRRDGGAIGQCEDSIEPLTDEIRKEWREAALKYKIVAFCNDVAHGRVKIGDLPMRKRLALLAAIEMPDMPEEPEQQALPGVTTDASK